MNCNFFKNKNVLSFLGGAAAIIVGKQLVESKAVHDACVSTVAKGMSFYKEAKAAALNIKEEAEDICEEARSSIEDED